MSVKTPQTPEERTIPEGYEPIEHHDTFDLFNEEKGIVITIHKRTEMIGEYDYKVIGAQDQVGFYKGSFQSLSHAEDKVLELAQNN